MAYQQQSSSFWVRLRGATTRDRAAPENHFVDATQYPSFGVAPEDQPTELIDQSPSNTTLQEESGFEIEGLRSPSSAVRCAIPVTLRMLTGNPRALITLLDVDHSIVQVEHALPDLATVWIRLPFACGSEVVKGRVKGSTRRTPSSPWEVLVKFEVASAGTRDGLVGLVRALKERSRR
ncbi:MAG: hypothetical protein AAGA48_04885 [Myxococcota bacterium]